MIRLILLISLSSSPLIFSKAQNLTESEQRFLGSNADQYLNAYRYPQRKIESSSFSGKQIADRYLNSKAKPHAVVIQSQDRPNSEIGLTRLPQVGPINPPSTLSIRNPTFVPPTTALKASNQTSVNIAIPVQPQETALIETTREATQMQKDIAEMRGGDDPAGRTANATAIVEPVKAPEIIKVKTATQTQATANAVNEAATESSQKVEELRKLIEQLKQTKR